jgi:hypothetical protein
MAIRKGIAKPIGSLTEMGTIRLGKRTEGRSPAIRDFVPLATYDQLVFGGWDIFEDNCYEAAKHAGVLEEKLLDQVKDELAAIKPMPAVFDRQYVKRLDGPNVKKGKNKKDLANQLIADIRKFKADNNCDRLVLLWVGSTEVYMTEAPCHQSLEAFEKGLEASDPAISSSLVYAYAAISEGIPYANAAPNLSAEIPALQELAQKTGSPIVGNDMKTGQTLIKTIIAPGLKARMLGVHGWYSTNILGNRDGEVLDDPESFKTKEESKKGALDYIFSRSSIRISTRTCRTLSASTTTRRAATTRRVGQHRPLRMARLQDAAQDQFPVPRQHPGRAHRGRRRAVPGSGEALRHVGHPGVAVVLFQEPDVRERLVSRARSLHSADEAEEHAPPPER